MSKVKRTRIDEHVTDDPELAAAYKAAKQREEEGRKAEADHAAWLKQREAEEARLAAIENKQAAETAKYIAILDEKK